ncbi:MAG: rhodanese-like domain-containing protein [Clostridia bacterium]|jgi:phage shock protein E|nr:rhodanese-like domain-containing protein [Clostridia bacterium]
MKLNEFLRKICKCTRSGSGIRQIQIDGLKKLLKSNNLVTLVDTRSPQEFAENRLNGAINIPEYEIAKKACNLLPNRDAIIVLYCQSGERSKKAYFILSKLGYSNLYDLEGGLDNI